MPCSTVDARLPGYVTEVFSILQDIHDALREPEQNNDSCENSSNDSDSDGSTDDQEPSSAITHDDNTLSNPTQQETLRNEAWSPRKRIAPPTTRQEPVGQAASNDHVEEWLNSVENDWTDSADDSSDDDSDDASTASAIAHGPDNHHQHDDEYDRDNGSAEDHNNATFGTEEGRWHESDTLYQASSRHNGPATTANDSPTSFFNTDFVATLNDSHRYPHFHIIYRDQLWDVNWFGVSHRIIMPITGACNDPHCIHASAAEFIAHVEEINRNSQARPGTEIQVWWIRQGSPPPAYTKIDPIVQRENSLLALQIMSRLSEAHEAQGHDRVLEDYVWPMFEAREGELSALDYRGEILPEYHEIEWMGDEPPVSCARISALPSASVG